jgi:Flp pilus assembly protein CpaB
MRRSGIKSFSLAMMAVAIAAIGLLALLIVDHGPGNKPQAATGAQPNTQAAAQAVALPSLRRRHSHRLNRLFLDQSRRSLQYLHPSDNNR